MEYDFDTIRRVVKELASPNLIQNWIMSVVDHIVSDDWRQVVTLHGKQSSSEHNLV